MEKFKTVDEYIAKASDEARPMLEQIRGIIKKAAPEATEKISYAMPYYGYHGRLIYFAGFKHHVGVYAMSDAMEACKDEVKPYRVAKATLHFKIDEPLPAALITKLVKAQMAANEARTK